MQSKRVTASFMYIFAMALAIASTVAYHMAQKALPSDAHPVVSLAVTYLCAAVGCLLLLPLFPVSEGWQVAFSKLNWAIFLLAGAVLGIELGFLLAYRAGWQIGLGGLVANIGATLLLIPIGLIFFRERLSLVQIIGGILCVIGLILINQRT